MNDSVYRILSFVADPPPATVVPPVGHAVNEEAILLTRLFGAFSFLIFVCFSVSLNSLLLIVLVKNNWHFSKIPFYIIVWQFVICDYMEHFVQIFIALPTTFIGKELYNHHHNSLLFDGIAVFETLAYNGTLYFNLLLTINRVIVLLVPLCSAAFLFEMPYVKFTVLAVWLFTLTVVVMINVCGCKKNFSAKDFYFFHDCRDDISGWCYVFIQVFTVYAGTVLPLAMLAVYLCIFFLIRAFRRQKASRNDVSRRIRKREFEFLIQSFLICGVLVAENLAFQTIPRVLASLEPVTSFSSSSFHATSAATTAAAAHARPQWRFYLNFVGNYFLLLNNSISPMILFTFNSDTRARLAELVGHVSGQKTALKTADAATMLAVTHTNNNNNDFGPLFVVRKPMMLR